MTLQLTTLFNVYKGKYMKLPVSEYKLETNVENAVDVVIGQKQSSKILTFLRDNIYENPKQSMIKELISNSLDVHVENNVARPIEITLPNTFNNLLVIRDFGTGLSKEFMSTKYTQVGFSTKEESELSLGAYGIGRLSPLAYTDVYYIDSYYKGTYSKYMLTVYDEGAKKKVSLLNIGEWATNEPSGLKVSIPIKEEDYSSIESIVKEHCRYLHNQPPLINGKPAELVPKIIEGNGWYITYSFSSSIVGLIGGMPNKIKDISDYIKSTNEIYAYNKLGLVINIPIGSVTQTASKDIQKTKFTENTITKLFDNVKAEILEAYQTKLNTIDNLVEAIHLISFLDSNLYSKLKWRDIEFEKYYGVYFGHTSCTITNIKNKNLNKAVTSYLPIANYYKVYINDLENANQKILREQLQEKYGDNVYIISNITTKDFNNLYNFPLLSSVISLEDLIPTTKRRISNTPKKKVDTSEVTAYYLRENVSLQTYCATNKVRVAKSPDRTEYYLELTDSNKKLVRNNEFYNKQTKHTNIYLFENISKLDLEVWVDFHDYLKEKVNKLLKQTPHLLEFVDFYYNYTELWLILEWFKNIQDCDLKEFYKKCKKLFNVYYSLSSEETNLLKLEVYNQTKLNELKLDNTLLKDYRKLETKYPLIFKHYSRHNSITQNLSYKFKDTELTLEEVNQYIGLINNAINTL